MEKFPDDLPEIVVWRLSWSRFYKAWITLASYPRRPVAFISTSGKTDAATVRPNIPFGATGWRLLGDPQGEWRHMKSLPRHWLPFLQRERGTAMDPRPRHEEPKAKVSAAILRDARRREMEEMQERGE